MPLFPLAAWLPRVLPRIFAARPRRRVDPLLRERYLAAVEALPPDQYAVFKLHGFGAVSIAEVAVRLDIPSAEVEQRLASALLAIARAID